MKVNLVFSIWDNDKQEYVCRGDINIIEKWVEMTKNNKLNFLNKIVKFNYHGVKRIVKVEKIYKGQRNWYLEGKDLTDEDHYKRFLESDIENFEVV